MRNVGVHRSVALTVHVPEEQAQLVIAAFGWPTAASPVPVALARLTSGSSNGKTSVSKTENEGSTPSPGAKRNWEALEPAQQAGIRCNEEPFRRFLKETYSMAGDPAGIVRHLCGVLSRADLNTNQKARVIWQQMDGRYQRWLNEPVPA